MNNSIFIFQINENEKIIIKIDTYPEDVPYCFYQAYFYIVQYDHKILLSYDSLPSHLEAFIIALNHT